MRQTPPLGRNLGVMKAHGVPHLADHLAGLIDIREAMARGKADTRRYARRQVIFARKYLSGPRWRWFSGEEAAAQAAACLLSDGLLAPS